MLERDKAIQYVDQLEAHLDEGGKLGPNNMRDLILFVRKLAAESCEIDKLQIENKKLRTQQWLDSGAAAEYGFP